MDLLTISELRFHRSPDGAIWTPGPFRYTSWSQHFDLFDRVLVVARVRYNPEVPPSFHRADGPRVSLVPVPYYVGPTWYLARLPQVRRAVRKAFEPGCAVVFRLGSQLATLLAPVLDRMGYPYGVRVVGDPREVFAPGAVKHPLRPLFQFWAPRQLRRICAGACAVSYVTERTLQKQYPARPDALVTHYTDALLNDVQPPRRPRPGSNHRGPWTLLTIGSMEQPYKGMDVLIDAVARLTRDGLDVRLVVVGDGRYRRSLERQAVREGLDQRIHFLGAVSPGRPITEQFDRADLFVLASRTEGLPRAMVEAMTHAVPCLGSTAGGIPELLHPEDMVPPGDPSALAGKIREALKDPERMTRMSERNVDRAKDFSSERVAPRRAAFYAHIARMTERWLESQSTA